MCRHSSHCAKILRMLLPLLLLLLLCLVPPASPHGPISQEWHSWPSRSTYYYSSLRDKAALLLASHLSKGCLYGEEGAQIQFMADNDLLPDPGPTASSTSTSASSSSSTTSLLQASSWPVSKQPGGTALVKLWRSMRRPRQHRVDPYLCEAVYSKKYPLFNNTQGCQLRHYMHPGAPRCQALYLKHLCAAASIDIFNSSSNGFVMQEADHAHGDTLFPPEPYLVKATRALVSKCGDISLPCGVMHARYVCRCVWCMCVCVCADVCISLTLSSALLLQRKLHDHWQHLAGQPVPPGMQPRQREVQCCRWHRWCCSRYAPSAPASSCGRPTGHAMRRRRAVGF